jgi:hypothetical protein
MENKIMSGNKCIAFTVGVIAMSAGTTRYAGSLEKQPGVVKMDFIFDRAPFGECHA